MSSMRYQIEKLIHDEGLSHSLAQEGNKRIKDFTWSALANRLE